jgi:hypothetical protein
MDYQEYEAERIKFYLSHKLEQVTQEEFYEQLEMLPPLMWKSYSDSYGSCQYFFVSEMTIGTVTLQYYESNGKFFKKYADFKDRTTWIDQLAIYKLQKKLDSKYYLHELAITCLICEAINMPYWISEHWLYSASVNQ